MRGELGYRHDVPSFYSQAEDELDHFCEIGTADVLEDLYELRSEVTILATRSSGPPEHLRTLAVSRFCEGLVEGKEIAYVEIASRFDDYAEYYGEAVTRWAIEAKPVAEAACARGTDEVAADVWEVVRQWKYRGAMGARPTEETVPRHLRQRFVDVFCNAFNWYEKN